MRRADREGGQASLLLLGAMFVLVAGVVVLFAFGSALGAKGKHQRAADLAAVSAAQVMRDLLPRLFEAPLLANGLPIRGIWRCRAIWHALGRRRCGAGAATG